MVLSNFEESFLPNIIVSSTIFKFDGDGLRVLLIHDASSNYSHLPFGLVKKNENILYSNKRILLEIAGVSNVYIEKIGFYDYPSPSQSFLNILKSTNSVIFLGYFALFSPFLSFLEKDKISDRMLWVKLEDIHHYKIPIEDFNLITNAKKKLKDSLAILPLGYNLLPEKFTISDIQKMHECILETKFNRGNFYRRIKKLGILKKLTTQINQGAYKPSDLYSYDQEMYIKSLGTALTNWL